MREKFAAAAKHLVLLPPGRHDSSHPFDRMIARRRVRAPTSAGWALPALARGALSFPRESSEVRLLEALLRGDRFVYVTGAAGSGKSHVVATVLERLGRSRNAGLFSNVLHVNCGGTNAGDLACGAHCETRFLVLLAAALLMDSDARALFAWLDGATNDACAAANRVLFTASGCFVVNLMSSPGSGKTTLLKRVLTEAQRTKMKALDEALKLVDTGAQAEAFLLMPNKCRDTPATAEDSVIQDPLGGIRYGSVCTQGLQRAGGFTRAR